MQDYWTSHLGALALPDQPEAAFRSLQSVAEALVGVKLFSVMIHDRPNNRGRRVYSSMDEVYPTGGWKKLVESKYSEQVLDRHEPYVNRTIEDIREVFFDHEQIQALGLESSCHIPVVAAGRVIGVCNLLHESGYYTEDRLARAMELRPFALAPLLLARRHYGID